MKIPEPKEKHEGGSGSGGLGGADTLCVAVHPPSTEEEKCCKKQKGKILGDDGHYDNCPAKKHPQDEALRREGGSPINDSTLEERYESEVPYGYSTKQLLEFISNEKEKSKAEARADERRRVREWAMGRKEDWASNEHDRWARWQKYMFSKCDTQSEALGGGYIVPKELVERWNRQIDTKYADLSEAEKESDRKEVQPYLDDLLTALGEEVGDCRIYVKDDLCGGFHKKNTDFPATPCGMCGKRKDDTGEEVKN